MKALVTRVLVFFSALAQELERVLPRPVVPLTASVSIHLMLLPLVYLVIFFEPEPEGTRVFLLEGGLAMGEGTDAEWEDEEEEVDLDEEEDDDWDEDAVDTTDPEKFDRWGFPLPGAFDDEEEDEDWDSDWFKKKKWVDEDDELDEDGEEDDTLIIDDDLDEEVDLAEYDIEIEEEEDEQDIAEQIGKIGSDAKKWENLFAEAEEPAVASPSGKVARSEVDEKILALIERNPYDDVSSGTDPVPLSLSSGVSFAEYDARLPELLDWMPPDSLMAALISLELLRARPDREELEKTFKSLGYFRQIAGGSELSFFEDIDAVLIASSDPLDVQETFVILRHRLDEGKVRSAIDKQFKSLKLKSNWYEVEGRQVVQADKESFEKLPWIYFLPRPGFVAVLHASKRDRLTTYMGTDSFGPGASARLMGDLERYMRFGLITPMIESSILDVDGEPVETSAPMPVAVVLGCILFKDAFKEVVDGSTFPAPDSVLVTGRFGEAGAIDMQGNASFATDEEADGFIAQWLKHVEPLRKNTLLKLIGAVDLIDLARWARKDDGRVDLEAYVEAEDVVRLMALVRLLTAEPEDKMEAPPKPAPGKAKPAPAKPKPKPKSAG